VRIRGWVSPFGLRLHQCRSPIEPVSIQPQYDQIDILCEYGGSHGAITGVQTALLRQLLGGCGVCRGVYSVNPQLGMGFRGFDNLWDTEVLSES